MLFAMVSGNAYCAEQNCTSCIAPYTLVSYQCLSFCPTGYNSKGTSCTFSYTTLISVNFLSDINFTENTVNSFVTPNEIAFNDPSKNTPIPTLDRGFYFGSTSQLLNVFPFSIGFSMSYNFVLRILRPGIIFQLLDANDTAYIIATAYSDIIQVDWLLFDDISGENITESISSAYDSNWYVLTISQVQYNDVINLQNFNITTSIYNCEFRGDTDLTFTLGSSVSSFQGFLTRLLVDNYLHTLVFITIFPDCDFNEYYIAANNSCGVCNPSYPAWPWCVRDSPNVCYTGCSECIGLGYSGCTTCEDSTKTPPGCSDGKNCTTFVNTFKCSGCDTGLLLIGGLCVNEPYLYDANSQNTPVINVVFDSFRQYFGPFQSGDNAATYCYNNMEDDDPPILKQRGIYIENGKFLMTSIDIVLNHDLTIAMWVQLLSSGDVIYKETFIISATMKAEMLLANPERIAAYYQRELQIINNPGTWELYTIILSCTNGVTNFSPSRSQSSTVPTYSVYGYALYDNPSPLYLGAYPSQNDQKAFIYNFQLWNVALSTSELTPFITLGLCPAVPVSDCMIKCAESTYYNEYIYACMPCPVTCTYGCTRWDSCHYCSDIHCDQCTDFVSNCTQDVSNPCISPSVLSGSGSTCCDQSCLECYESNSYQCTACGAGLFLLSQICVSVCPIGYQGGSRNCLMSTSTAMDITISGFQISGSNYFTAANSLQYYPVTASGQPLPSLNRGYYFNGSTSVISDDVLLSYNLTFVIWIKQMQPGIILQKNSMYLTSNSTNITFTYSTSIKSGFPGLPNTQWNLFSLQYSSNMISNFSVGISYQPTSFTVRYPGIFMIIDTSSPLILGDSQASFQGFIYSLQIYNTLLTSITTTLKQCTFSIETSCQWDCDIDYYWSSSSCLSCKYNCPEGCIGGTYCNLCSDPICYNCSDFYGQCSKCKGNATLVGSICECDIGFYWDIGLETCEVCSDVCLTCSGPNSFDCTSCKNSKYLLAQICMDICPIGYQETSGYCLMTASKVVDFAVKDFNISGDNYFTNANAIKYYPVTNTSQPLPALNRGYYFSYNTSMASDTILLSYNLTIVLWIKQINPGIILQKSLMNFTSKSAGMIFNYSTSIHLTFPGLSNTHWNLLSLKYSSDYNSNLAVAVSYPPGSFTVNTPGILMIMDFCSPLILGDSSASFNGFIYSLQIYNTLLTIIPSFLQQCTSSTEINCLWDCDINHYWSESACVSCKFGCTNGCIGGTYCNLCSDPICYNCTDFYGVCNQCKGNAALVGTTCQCNIGFYWDIELEQCSLCSYTCLSCSGPNNNDCTSCAYNQTIVDGCCECVHGFYQIGTGRCIACDSSCSTCMLPGFFSCTSCDNFLLVSVCIDICPIGYFNISSVCYASYNSSAAVNFDFSNIEDTYIDTVLGLPASTGNDSSFYPNYRPSDPIAAIGRGIYFTGNGSYLTFPLPYNNFRLFGLKFSISLWINPLSLFGTVFYKTDTHGNQIFTFSLIGGIYQVLISLFSQLQVYTAINPLQQQEWSFITLSLDYNSGSYLNINTNKVPSTSIYLSDAPFVDIRNSVLVVGTFSYISAYFTGFLYEISIYTYIPDVNSLMLDVTVCSTCSQCSLLGTCFSTCNITSYPISDSCGQCPPSCSTGCRNGDSCGLCTTTNCLICSDYTEDSCTQCDAGYELVNEVCVACNSTSYYDESNFLCMQCGTLCSTCKDGLSCSNCEDNSALTNTSTCECIQGYTYQGVCTRNLFFGILEIYANNSVSLIFSEPLQSSLNTSNMQVIISQISHNFTIVQTDNYTWSLTILFHSTIIEGTILELKFIGAVNSIYNSLLVTNKLTALLFGVEIDSTASEITKIISFAKNGLTFGVASSMGIGALNLNPTTFFNFLNSAQIYSYISLYQIEVDPLLIEFLMSLNVNSMLPNIPQQYISSSEGTALNQQFSNFGYSNALLLVNSGVNISILAVLFVLLGIIYSLKFVEINWIKQRAREMQDKFKYAIFLRFWIQSYLDFLFNSSIGIVFMSPRDFLEFFDLCLCCLLLVIPIQLIQVTFTLLLPYLLIKRSIIIHQLSLQQYEKEFSTFFDEFRDELLSSSWYYFLFISRRLFLTLCILFIKDPLVQLVVSAIFCLIVAYI